MVERDMAERGPFLSINFLIASAMALSVWDAVFKRKNRKRNNKKEMKRRDEKIKRREEKRKIKKKIKIYQLAQQVHHFQICVI